ncbi:hypothetical protein GCM10022393_41500 [Aquimarina addita]|uniref:DUF2004 domain-containing protein n=1 Tax=Aquimarina addita TaxID=870485 RepID=A0ABP6UU28_9FLAO
MKKHTYWGLIEEDWAGFSSKIKFITPHFDTKKVTIFLGEEYDDDGEEIEKAPSNEELDTYQKTYSDFIMHLDQIIEDIKEKSYQRYIELYAHYYENEDKSGEKPLGIHTKEEHFTYLKDIKYLRILKHGNIKILIHYKIDQEHGIEIRLENNKIIDIAGIAET